MTEAKKTKKKIAKLNKAEDRAWVWAFNHHLDSGKTTSQADKLAWSDVQKEFPRLRKFDSCK